MTIETATYVELQRTTQVSQLLDEIETFARRAGKAKAGDTTDADKVLGAVSSLEGLAREAQTNGAALAPVTDSRDGPVVARDHDELAPLHADLRASIDTWITRGSVAVLVVDPLAAGASLPPEAQPQAATPPVFRSRSHNESAVTQRFRKQCASGNPGDVIEPSKMKDYALTDALHEFVFEQGPSRRAQVVYADGSAGPDFLFGGLTVDTSQRFERSVRLSLMSIRHMEMDAITHGSWFRNVDLSRGVPHGDIDADATDRSRQQLAQLLRDDEPVEIHLYLTAFVPAVMAFFRSVAEVLHERGGVLRVRPMFYRPDRSSDRYVESSGIWSVQ